MNGTDLLHGTLSAGSFSDRLPPLRQRADVQNAWLKERLDTFLPSLMRREGFDMWIINTREYNEDPVVMSLLPEPAMSARRRTILVFALTEDGTVERLSLDRYGIKGFYERAWEPKEETQYECLGRVVRERDPQRIGIDTSDEFAFGDGLTHTEYNELSAALGETLMARVESAERLAVGWLEHRIAPELTVYPSIIALGHAIIAEAFSSRVVQPGVTTTDDVRWWMREKMASLNLRPWFMPDVEIQAADQPFDANFGARRELRTLIQPGDVLHCDMGYWYLGLASDQQQMAYVLRLGESEAPESLRAALATGNRLQDIHLEEMKIGRTGNEVLASALSRANEEGIEGQIYTHPIGYHGHAAGPTIGLWDHQDGVPGRGDYPVFDNTCYSIELNIRQAVPEWDGAQVMMGLEEEAGMIDGQMHWLAGRGEKLHLIG